MSKEASTYKYAVVAAVVIITIAVLRFSDILLTGAKPLRDVHPWDYILMIVSIIVVVAGIAYAHAKRKA